MQPATGLGNRLLNVASLGAGAAGVRWSGPDYQVYFEWIVYLSLAWGLWSICREAWSNRTALTQRLKMIQPSHVIILGLAIAVIGVVWQMRVVAPNTRLGTTNSGGRESLAWVFSGMAGKSDANGFRVGDIQFWSAKNKTGKAIRLVDAYIQSGIDGGKKRRLLLNTLEHGLIPLEQASPIPANTENITLMAEFPELSEADFMKDWGNISFFIQDSDHTFQGKVDERIFREVFDSYRPKAPAPRATKAIENKPPQRFYSTADREEISAAFTRVSNILNKPTAAIESESQQLARLWEAKKYSSTDPRPDLRLLLERLEALRPISSEAFQGIEGVLKDFPRRKELLLEILGLPQTEREQPIPNWQYASNDLHGAVTTYSEIYDKIDARAREGFVVTANPIQTNFMNATGKLNDWIHQSNLRLKARENEIFQ